MARKRVKGQEKVGSPFRFHKPKVFPSLLLQTQTASCNYGSLCPSVPTRLSVLLAKALLSLFSIPIVENKDSFALQVESFSFNKCLLVCLAEIHHHWTPPAICWVSFHFLLLWLLLNHSCFWQPYTHFAVLHYICLWISLKTYKHFFVLHLAFVYFQEKEEENSDLWDEVPTWSPVNTLTELSDPCEWRGRGRGRDDPGF